MLELDRHVGQRIRVGIKIDKPLLGITLTKVTPGAGVTLEFERPNQEIEAVTLRLRTPHTFKVGHFDVSLTLLRMDRAQLRLGFEAPKALKIEREERYEQLQRERGNRP